MINEIVLIVVSIVAAVATFVASVRYNMGPVKASALLSLAVGVFFYAFPWVVPEYLARTIPVAFIGASFCGMSSEKTVLNNWWMAFAGLVFGFIFVNTSKFFAGYGGGLGTTACLSVVVALGLMQIVKRIIPHK